MYGVYLHVLADTLGSVGVIVSSLLIQWKEWHIADPISSAMISLLILGSTLPLLKETLLQLLQRVPKEMERDVARALEEVQSQVDGVFTIKQWHFWRHANDLCVGSLHLVVSLHADEQVVLQQTRMIFMRRTQLEQFLTVQVEKQQPVDKCDARHDDGSCHDRARSPISSMSTHENPAGDSHAHHHRPNPETCRSGRHAHHPHPQMVFHPVGAVKETVAHSQVPERGTAPQDLWHHSHPQNLSTAPTFRAYSSAAPTMRRPLQNQGPSH